MYRALYVPNTVLVPALVPTCTTYFGTYVLLVMVHVKESARYSRVGILVSACRTRMDEGI